MRIIKTRMERRRAWNRGYGYSIYCANKNFIYLSLLLSWQLAILLHVHIYTWKPENETSCSRQNVLCSHIQTFNVLYSCVCWRFQVYNIVITLYALLENLCRDPWPLTHPPHSLLWPIKTSASCHLSMVRSHHMQCIALPVGVGVGVGGCVGVCVCVGVCYCIIASKLSFSLRPCRVILCRHYLRDSPLDYMYMYIHVCIIHLMNKLSH